MRHRSSAAGLLAGLMLIFTLAAPALAAEPAHDEAVAPTRTVHAVRTTQVRLDPDECPGHAARRAALATTTPRPTETCTAELIVELTASHTAPTTASVARAGTERLVTASACTITWTISSLRATVQSVLWGLFWSASVNATGYGDSCGRVMWTSVTCDQHGIGYAVHIDWCGAFPNRWTWYAYTSSNIGLNITVSAVANGTPISWTHGARNGFNPYAGTQYGFSAW